MCARLGHSKSPTLRQPRAVHALTTLMSVQVFFWFSGHGAAGPGGSQLLIGEDGFAINFLDEFDTHVTRALQRDGSRPRRGATVVAVLDCCRDALPQAASQMGTTTDANDVTSDTETSQFEDEEYLYPSDSDDTPVAPPFTEPVRPWHQL
jgi:hypothetical protein